MKYQFKTPRGWTANGYPVVNHRRGYAWSPWPRSASSSQNLWLPNNYTLINTQKAGMPGTPDSETA